MAKNVKDLLVEAAKFPAAVEARLPQGAPLISTTLVDITARLPVVPDFPMEVPNLPAPPVLPELPVPPSPPVGEVGAGLKPYVSGVQLSPVRQVIIPSPFVGVVPEVVTRRGM